MTILEFKHLDAYVKVYDLQSFSKAADEMFLSQPSISAYISSLENELQTSLIYRSAKEFTPTKSGKLFYEYAKDMLTLREKSIFALKNFTDVTVGSIDILASSVPAQYILPEMLGVFHKAHPNIAFNLTQADSSDVVKGISSHKSDVGFVGAKIENPKCIYEDFMTEKLVIIAPNEDRFVRITRSDIPRLLRSEYFVTREDGSGTRLEYEEFLNGIGVPPDKLNVSATFNNTQSIIHAVANGLGLSIISKLAARQYIKQKLIVPIDDGSLPERKFYIVLKKNCEVMPIANLFINFALSYAHKDEAL